MADFRKNEIDQSSLGPVAPVSGLPTGVTNEPAQPAPNKEFSPDQSPKLKPLGSPGFDGSRPVEIPTKTTYHQPWRSRY